jgi:hypothetical protein
VVHSTSLVAWDKICADGEVKAVSLLPQRPLSLDSSSEVAQYLRNEPPEYSDYIMFGTIASTTPEKIVVSYQTMSFILDDDAAYEPGVRLYFDNHRIIGDNLATRDGLHVMKVHKQLPLSPYLLAAIRVIDLDPRRDVKVWTPRVFVERSDKAFWSQSTSYRKA